MLLPFLWLKGSADFSFSGLKTAVLHLTQQIEALEIKAIDDIAASFQQAVVDVLVTKTIEAAKAHQARQILVAGGVASNNLLRDTMSHRSPVPVRFPTPSLCTDNAAMIAACAYFRLKEGRDSWDLDVVPSLRLA